MASSLVLFLLFSIFSLNAYMTSASSLGMSMDLIHRDSPRSPYYNPSLTTKDRIRAIVDRSLARARYLSSLISNSTAITSSPSSAGAKIIPNSFEYLMEFEIGSPPFTVLGIADTGSDLTWLQCKPCIQCYPQIPPIFDPTNSSTFSTVSCSTDSCEALPTAGCATDSSCLYQYSYGDQSYTIGNLAQETLTFSSDSNGGSSSIPQLFFGCSHESQGTFDKHGGGLVGLGGGSLSLVSQLGSSIDGKFSYCLVPYSENATSTLNFGQDAAVNGPGVVSTPIIPGSPDTFYFLSLEEIAVGNDANNNNNIPSGSTRTGGKKDELEGNIIIDSGTTVTFIPSTVLNPLVTTLSDKIKLTKVDDPDGFFPLCFEDDGSASDDAFPDITFKFTNAPVVLSPLQAFLRISDDVVCLGLVSSDDMGISIYGNVAQQNFHIGYDLANRLLSIAPAQCSKF